MPKTRPSCRPFRLVETFHYHFSKSETNLSSNVLACGCDTDHCLGVFPELIQNRQHLIRGDYCLTGTDGGVMARPTMAAPSCSIL